MKLSIRMICSCLAVSGLIACQGGGGGGSAGVNTGFLKGSWQETSAKFKSDSQPRLADVDGYVDVSPNPGTTSPDPQKIFMTFDDSKVTVTNVIKGSPEHSGSGSYNYRLDGAKLVNTTSQGDSASIKSIDSNTFELTDDKDGTVMKMIRVSDAVVKAAQVETQSYVDNWQPAISMGSGNQKYSCALNQAPAKVVNRCGTPRKHGGEVADEVVNVNGLGFHVWAAPQTYEQLYVYDCTDACGNKHTIVGDVSWDCVAPQEIAAMGLDTPDSDSSQGACSSPGSTPDLTKHFNLFIKKQFNNEKLRPAEMPAPVQGINYWDGDNK